MKKLFAAVTMAAAVAAGAASATPISAGGTLSGVSILGTASIYGVFGVKDPGDSGSTLAVITSFASGSGNVFSFSATGEIGCCGGLDPGFTPDGAGGNMNVTGANGLSSLSGNSLIPLVGVFTTDTSPIGGVAPAALSFDSAAPSSLSPLLNQVFYIGDGRTGYNNAAGSALAFTAPTTATRLYLGVIDAFGFNGQSGFYSDNPGSFSVDVHLAAANGGVPEPASWALMILGFGGAGAALRRRRRPLATAA